MRTRSWFGRRQALLLWVGVAAFLLCGLFGTVPRRAVAQELRFHIERYDSRITVNRDGSLDITEFVEYVFESGTFRRGLRTWELDRLEGIRDISVREYVGGFLGYIPYNRTTFDPDDSTSGAPRTFGTERRDGELRLRWIYGPTSNATRTFEISYHVDGAIRVYANVDRFDWFAVPPRSNQRIDNSNVAVTFPEGSDTSDWETASIPRNAETSKAGNTITWSAAGGLDIGFEVGADIPKGVLEATKPSWQDSFDAENPDSIVTGVDTQPSGPKAWLDLGVLLLAIVVLIGGVLWRLAQWYLTGRDKVVKLPIDYLAIPPSDLPPGLVGVLLDETADHRDLIATLADLGRKGKLSIAETKEGSKRDFVYTLKDTRVDYAYEQLLLGVAFGNAPAGQSTRLSTFGSHIKLSQENIYNEMYKNLVALKYFPESPKAVRDRGTGGCCGLLFFGGVALAAGFFFGEALSYMLIFLGVALSVMAFVYVFTADAMPRKTDFGSEEAAKWRAFKRYLQDIQKYTNVQAAADKLQEYLPYAVAMGIEREFVWAYNSVPQALPAWYTPYGLDTVAVDILARTVGTTLMSAPPGGGGTVAMPNLDPGAAMQGMSESLGSAMQGLSDSFTGMVNAASGVFSGKEAVGTATKVAGSAASGVGGEVVGKVAGSVGGLLVQVAIGVIFGGGGGGGGSIGAD